MKTRSVLIFSFVILALDCFGQQRTTSESLDSLRTSFYVDADEMVSEFENYAREAEEEYRVSRKLVGIKLMCRNRTLTFAPWKTNISGPWQV